MSNPIAVVALDGKVHIAVGMYEGSLTPEQADDLWNAIAEAELVALEQQVRARRRVTEGARGGWVNAPAQDRHAAGTAAAGICLATDGKFYCTLAEGHDGPHEARDTEERICSTWPAARHAVDAGLALAESTTAALNRLAGHTHAYPHEHTNANVACPCMACRREFAARSAAPGPGDPYPAPDYQHPEPDDD